MPYIPKDYLMICDRCGGQYRKSEMKEEWTGLWVCTRGCWEPQHPQDFVEGVEDTMSVPVARPDVVAAMGKTTLASDAAANATTVVLTSVAGLAEDDPIGIELDDGTVHWSFIDTLAGTSATLASYLFSKATAGNTVYLPSLNNETWV